MQWQPEPGREALQQRAHALGRRNAQCTGTWPLPLGSTRGLTTAQPQLGAPSLRAMPGRQGFKNGDSGDRRGRRNPLVRPPGVFGLMLEDGADDHGDLVVGHGAGTTLHAASLKIQDLAQPRPDEVGDDDKACRVEHVDRQRKVVDRQDWPRLTRHLDACVLQRARCRVRAGIDEATTLVGCRRGRRVDVPGLQDRGCTVAHQADGALDQRYRHGLRGIRPAADVRVAHAGDLTVAAAGERVDAQSVVELVAKAMEVGEQVEILLHRRGGECITPRSGALGERALKPQQCRRVEIGEAREAGLIHPAHKLAQVHEVAGRRACALRQAGAQRAAADKRDELLAAVQQPCIPRFHEDVTAGEFETPVDSHRLGFFESVRRLEDPDRVVPTRVEPFGVRLLV